MKKLFLLLAVTLAGMGFNKISGQVTADSYLGYAKHNAVIYSGPIAQKYPFIYQETYYAFRDDFTANDLYYNGKLYKAVVLNLNSNSDELIVKVPEGGKNVVLNRNMVEWFTLDSKKFIAVKDGEYENLPGGYYEALYEGEGLVLKKITKLFSEGVEDQKVVYTFVPVIKRYAVKNGTAYPVKTLGDFTKVYKENKAGIRKFIKAQGRLFSSKMSLDNSLTAVMKFVEQQ